MLKTKKAIEMLNELFALDTEATRKLFAFDVKCNEEVADHPHFVVRTTDKTDGFEFHLSILGVINGMLTATGQQKVAGMYEEKDVLVGFMRYKEPKKE